MLRQAAHRTRSQLPPEEWAGVPHRSCRPCHPALSWAAAAVRAAPVLVPTDSVPADQCSGRTHLLLPQRLTPGPVGLRSASTSAPSRHDDRVAGLDRQVLLSLATVQYFLVAK